jgi:transposase
MRKSFSGLCGLTREVLGHDPTDGALFVFMNRARTFMKVLYYERGGFCLWSKRLERGTFELPASDDGGASYRLRLVELLQLIDGVSLAEKRRKRL